MSESIPVGDLVRELCERLGVPYGRTCIVTISPMRVTVATWRPKVSLIREHAPSRYLVSPPGWENPVWIEREFEVDTSGV